MKVHPQLKVHPSTNAPSPPNGDKTVEPDSELTEAEHRFLHEWSTTVGAKPIAISSFRGLQSPGEKDLSGIAKGTLKIQMGKSVEDQIKYTIDKLLGKTVIGLTIVEDKGRYSLKGSLTKLPIVAENWT